MRDWGISSFKSIKVYNKSLINSRLNSFEYQNPDVFYKKEQENAMTEQILNIFNQMIELKTKNETNFAYFQTQIEYYLTMMSQNTALFNLYENVLEAIKNEEFSGKSEHYKLINDKIENFRQEIHNNNAKNSINLLKNNQNITNKTQFNLENTKKSFINHFNSLEEHEQSEFLASYDMTFSEINLLKNANKNEWVTFVRKMSHNSSQNQRNQVILGDEMIYFDEKLNRKIENKIESNSTEKYENILNFLENQNLQEWKVLKNEYLSFENTQEQIKLDITKIYDFAQNDVLQQNFENAAEISHAILNVRDNIASYIDLENANSSQVNTFEKFEKMLNNVEIAIQTNDFVRNITNNDINAKLSYKYENNLKNFSDNRKIDEKITENFTSNVAGNNFTEKNIEENINLDNFNSMKTENISEKTTFNQLFGENYNYNLTENSVNGDTNLNNQFRENNSVKNQKWYSIQEKPTNNFNFSDENKENLTKLAVLNQNLQKNDILELAQKVLNFKSIHKENNLSFTEDINSTRIENQSKIYDFATKILQNYKKSVEINAKNTEFHENISNSDILNFVQSIKMNTEDYFKNEMQELLNLEDFPKKTQNNFEDGVSVKNLKKEILISLLQKNPHFSEKISNILLKNQVLLQNVNKFDENISLSEIDKTSYFDNQSIEHLINILNILNESDWKSIEMALISSNNDLNISAKIANLFMSKDDSLSDFQTPYELKRTKFINALYHNSEIYAEFSELIRTNPTVRNLIFEKNAEISSSSELNIANQLSNQNLQQKMLNDIKISENYQEIISFVDKFNEIISFFDENEWNEFKNLVVETSENNDFSSEFSEIFAVNTDIVTNKNEQIHQLIDSLKINSFSGGSTVNESVQKQNLMNFFSENAWFAEKIIKNSFNSAQNTDFLAKYVSKEDVLRFNENIDIINNLHQNSNSNFIEQTEMSSSSKLNIANQQINQNLQQKTLNDIKISENYQEIISFVDEFNEIISFFDENEWNEFKNLVVETSENNDFNSEFSEIFTVNTDTVTNKNEQIRQLIDSLKINSFSGESTVNESVQKQNLMNFLSENAWFAENIIKNSFNSAQNTDFLAKFVSKEDVLRFNENIDIINNLHQNSKTNFLEQTEMSSSSKLNIANQLNNQNLQQKTLNDIKISENYQEIISFVDEFNEIISFFDENEWNEFKNLVIETSENNDFNSEFSEIFTVNTDIVTNKNEQIRQLIDSLKINSFDEANNTFNESVQKQNLMNFLSENAWFAEKIIKNSFNSAQNTDFLAKFVSKEDVLRFNENIDIINNLHQNSNSNFLEQTEMSSSIELNITNQQSNQNLQQKTLNDIKISENYQEIISFVDDFNEIISFFDENEWNEFKNIVIKTSENNDFNSAFSEIFTVNTDIVTNKNEKIHQLIDGLKINSFSGESTVNESVQKQNLMNFLSENAWFAENIIKNSFNSAQNTDFLAKYVSNEDVLRFNENIDIINNLHQKSNSNFIEQTEMSSSSELNITNQLSNQILQQKTINDIKISENYQEIISFVDEFNEIISFFDENEWNEFKNLVIETSENNDFNSEFSEIFAVNTDTVTNKNEQIHQLIDSLKINSFDEANNTFNESVQKQNLMNFFSENALLIENLVKNERFSTVFSKYFTYDEILNINQKVDIVKNDLLNYTQLNLHTEAKNRIQEQKINNETNFNFEQISRLLEKIDVDSFEKIVNSYQNSGIFSYSEINQLINPIVQVLNLDFSEMFHDIKNTQSFDDIVSDKVFDILKNAVTQPIGYDVNSSNHITNFARISSKIEHSKTRGNINDIAYFIQNNQSEPPPYIFANTVITRKKDTDFTPIVNTITDVVYERIVTENKVKNSFSNDDIVTTSNSASVANSEVLMEKIEKHEAELQKLQNEYKNILKITDISRINRRLEKKMQTSMKVQNVRNGF